MPLRLLDQMRETIGVRAVGAKAAGPGGRARGLHPEGPARAPPARHPLLLDEPRRGEPAPGRPLQPHLPVWTRPCARRHPCQSFDTIYWEGAERLHQHIKPEELLPNIARAPRPEQTVAGT